MNKKIILIGIIVIVLAFIIGSVALPNALSSISNFGTQSLVILPGQTSYTTYFLNETGFIIAGYQSNAAMNFYFVNQSGFDSLKGYFNSTLTLSQWARNHQGSGVIESITNSRVGIFPYSQFTNQTAVPTGSYISQNASILPAGNYYAILQNADNVTANVNVTSDVSANIQKQSGSIFAIGISVFIVFVAGIGIVIYGIIKKPKVPADQTNKSDDSKKIDELYKGVDRKKGKAKK